ncbi:beta strand repeat-containing protein [Acinetobacter sp. KB005]|uniref:beta strand repeat-containing protein n=1 Tax=Acinetobacter sp. KB005 TaxID=3416667 RepID=UPI003CE8CD5F
MFLLKNLVSSISKVTQDLGNVVSVNTNVNTGSAVNVNVSDIKISNVNVSTTGLLSNVLSTVTNTVTHTTTGLVSDVLGTVTGTVGSTNPLGTITNIIGGVTGGATGGNPVGVVTDIIGGVTGGIGGGTSPISPVIDVVQGGIDILQGVESLKTEIINTGIETVAGTVIGVLPQTEHPVSEIADLGTLTFETSRDTVNGALEVVSDLVGGDIQGATTSATGIADTLITNGTTAAGIITGVVGSVTDVVGGVTGGVGGNPLEVVTDIIGGVTGGVGGNPLEVVTDIIGGVTGGIGGGTSPISPVIDVVQGGIDILQGVESLKTEIINTGIETVAGTVIGVLPQTEHPVSEIADLGTLTFETSRDTVNGALETVSDLVGGDIQGATESATGILDTLITNGTTAAGIITGVVGSVTDVVGGVTGGVGGNPLEVVTDIIGGVTGGVSGNPLEVVTDIIGGVTGGVGGNPLDVVTDIIGGVTGGISGNPLEVVTDIIGGVTGGIGGGTSPISPVIDVVQGGIDILQGVESLKTEIINTGIDTVADTIIGILPQVEHPVSEIADLGTLTFETSRDTVNGALEVVSDLVGGDIQGATESATGILGTLITNGSTATGLLTEILGGVTGTIGGATGSVGGDSPLGVVTDLLGGLTGGVTGGDSPLGVVTDLLGGLTGGVTGGVGGDNPIGIVTDIVGSLTGGVTGGSGLDVISNLLGGLTSGGLLGGVTSTVSSVTNTTHTIVPQSLLTDNFLDNSFHTV